MKIIPQDKLIIRESFALYYGNSEIWGEELDRLSIHQDIVIEKFLKDMQQIAKNSTPSLIAINLNETAFNSNISDIIANNFYDARQYIKKVVFVGLSLKSRLIVKNSFKKLGASPEFIVTFINDYEKAKQWLVS